MSGGVRRLGPRPDAQTLASLRTAAEGMLAEAAREAESIRSEAAASARAEVAALLIAARAEYGRALVAESGTVATLACEIARAVLAREAETSPELLRRMVRRATERVLRARTLLLRVHPEDVVVVQASARAWLPDDEERVVLRVEGDAALARGDVIVETELGRVEARLDRIIDELARILDARPAVV